MILKSNGKNTKFLTECIRSEKYIDYIISHAPKIPKHQSCGQGGTI